MKTNKLTKKERIGYIIVSSMLILITVMAIKGFSELIVNQSAGVVMFYGLLAILLVWKLGDFLREPLTFLIKDFKYSYNPSKEQKK